MLFRLLQGFDCTVGPCLTLSDDAFRRRGMVKELAKPDLAQADELLRLASTFATLGVTQQHTLRFVAWRSEILRWSF